MTTLELLLVAGRLALGCWLLWCVRELARSATRTDLGSVSVVVPARDEERSLPTLLGTLPAGVELLVVDDHSSDRTAAVAREHGARVVDPGQVPDGWIGKSWACEQGAAAAAGAILVFVDADVRFGSGGCEAVVAELDRAGGLVSVQPHHEPGSLVERFAQLFNIVGFAGTDAGSPLGRARGVRGAFGPVLATRRHDYETVGRHASVRSSVVDDVALAARYRDAGLPVEILAGGSLVAFRMYPDGLRQLVEGFTKNMALGLKAIRRSTALIVLLWVSLLVQATVLPVRGAIRWLVADDPSTLAWAGALHVVVAAQVWWMGRRVGRFGLGTSLLFPLSTLLFLAVFARSAWASARGSVSWRGRRVRTRPHR